jgi:ATPase family protein associated with various cellular activities (AAA)
VIGVPLNRPLDVRKNGWVDYDLTRLGAREFEHLVQALVLRVLGAQVHVFGDGPDGGREATFNGQVIRYQGAKRETWDGYLVVQVKFRSRPLGIAQDTAWFINTVRKELQDWASPRSGRLKRSPSPEYLLFVTNVPLSGVSDSGGVDRIEALIKRFAKQIGLKGWQIWHFDKLCRLLDGEEDVRKAFSGLITPGDVLSRLYEYLSGITVSLNETMARYVAMELAADQWVRLSQAGDAANEKLTLSQIAIDLPIEDPPTLTQSPRSVEAINYIRGHRQPIEAAKYIIQRGDRVLRGRSEADKPPHLVLVGGPGQGKTTIGQLVCQAYRVAFMSKTSPIDAETSRLLESLQQRLNRIGLPQPASLRWPIRVDLRAYGDAVSAREPVSLLRYLSERVSSRTSDSLTPAFTRKWLQEWPWLLVLDGLDEVASAAARESLMQGISDFLVEAARVDADLFVVATTRPQGYTGEFSVDRYEHVVLSPLEPGQAAAYAQRLAEVRHATDPDMFQKTIERTRAAANEESTARLMRTPLQVTIMSILLERLDRAPRARYALFESYYKTIYAREMAKPGEVGELLEAERRHIDALHDRVGLLLHVRSEKEGEADASLPQSGLHELAILRLKKEDYDSREATRLADQIVMAVTQRLVLLVPKAEKDVGFEVRSIQEFMAARALVSGEDKVVAERLHKIVPSAHWRNVWLLAAGRIFAEREHMRGTVIALLDEVDNSSPFNIVVSPGADLALDLLDDDVAVSTPRFQRMIAKLALHLFQCPPDQSLVRRANVLFRCASDDIIREYTLRAIDQALEATPAQKMTALAVLEVWRKNIGVLGPHSRQLVAQQREMRRHTASIPAPPAQLTRTFADLLRPKLKEAQLSNQERQAGNSLLAELEKIHVPSEDTQLSAAQVLPTGLAKAWDRIDACFSSDSIAIATAEATMEAGTQAWAGASELRNLMRLWLQRRPSGEAVLAATPFPV